MTIYNLTAHVSNYAEVERQPRVSIEKDYSAGQDVIAEVKRIAAEIPRDSDVLIGGHSNLVCLLLQVAKIKRWTVWFYSSYADRIYKGSFLSRMDRLEVENNP